MHVFVLLIAAVVYDKMCFWIFLYSNLAVTLVIIQAYTQRAILLQNDKVFSNSDNRGSYKFTKRIYWNSDNWQLKSATVLIKIKGKANRKLT